MPEKAKKKKRNLNSVKPRQAKYIKGVMQGKTKKQAALDAGYAPSTANRAIEIEGSAVRAEFQKIIRRYINMERIGQRISEGMDALETKFFQMEGRVVESHDVIAWEERRRYSELAAKYGGYFIDKQEIEVDDKRESVDSERLAELLTGALERRNQVSQPSGTRGSSADSHQ